MTTINNTVWAVVPAAGTGQRIGGQIPKQYLPILDVAVIEHTLTALLQVSSLEGLVVALNSSDTDFVSLPLSQNDKVETTEGGGERSDSVLAALDYLQPKANDNDWVLVHDAARCCVRVDVINTMLEDLYNNDVGGILAVPASDTLKRVQGQLIDTTLDRSQIWQAQTPQLFRYGLLKAALKKAKATNYPVTDEASAMEWMGHDVTICMGHYDNIKVTHPEDLLLAAAILQQRVSTEKESS